MKSIKSFIKKYFTSFVFFYRYLRNKIFLALGLSIVVSFLDGLGLAMFFPLLEVVGGEGDKINSSQMGNLSFLIEGIEKLGFNLTLLTVLCVLLIFFVCKGIVKYIGDVYVIILQQSFIRQVRLDLLQRLNRMSFKKFILSDSGRIQNTMSGEVARVSQAFNYYFKTFQQGVMVAVYIGFAFSLNVQFAILVTIGGILTNFLYKVIYKKTKGLSRNLTSFNHVFQGQILQHVGHFKYLKGTGMVEMYARRLRETIFKIEDSQKQMGVLTSISTAAREPLLIVIIAVVIFTQVKFFGGSIGAILISLLFFYRALISLVTMQGNWNDFLKVSGSLENMQDFQQLLGSNYEKNGNIEFQNFSKGILLQHVSFGYGKLEILKDINFQIDKNESIAFVGESGSGKTTLVNLIAGLLYEDGGTVFIDDVPLKSLKKETYQKRLGYVSQDPVIFDDTIYNNVTFWSPQTRENISHFEQCIQQASLTDFLNELPKGKETELGNRGLNLSGGQKQRISIARELFKDIDILILDEATSALDSETEKAIQKSIDALQGKYTILIVAHRLSTIRNVDRIVFMNKGSIIDIGDFNGLTRSQERFRKMVELQEL